ncbi:MAG: c-type cytochrome [Gemmatimonadetes bacterium]|nr:c-type cytochrome [Gemmatimonadota bacterium]
MRSCVVRAAVLASLIAAPLAAQGKFPPDSLVNVKVLPKAGPVINFIGTMRNFAGALGVRCQHCHVGQEGQPLGTFNFVSDEKRTKLVARQMVQMVEEINRRLDSIPGRVAGGPAVTCQTCHRGVARPMPLTALLVDAAQAGGADSAVRAYRALRQRYYGRDAYDFSEITLTSAALRLARAGKRDEADAMLGLNEELFPNASGTALTRGNVVLLRGDTAGAVAAFREAIRRDSTNAEARGRLREVGGRP